MFKQSDLVRIKNDMLVPKWIDKGLIGMIIRPYVRKADPDPTNCFIVLFSNNRIRPVHIDYLEHVLV